MSTTPPWGRGGESGLPSWHGSFALSAAFVLAYPSSWPTQTNNPPISENAANLKYHHTYPDQPIPGLELFLRRFIVVNQRETRALSTAKVCPEPEGNDTVLVDLVEGSELLRELAPGHIGSGWVEDVNDELTSSHQTVGDEFACADGYWGVGLAGGRRRYVCPSNRRWRHPSHSSPRSIALFSRMAPLTDQRYSTHHFKGFSTALSVLIDDEGDVDGWGKRVGDDFAR